MLPKSQGNEDVRYRGAQNMLKTIQENAGDEPVVITGDFNANMNETPGCLDLPSGNLT